MRVHCGKSGLCSRYRSSRTTVAKKLRWNSTTTATLLLLWGTSAGDVEVPWWWRVADSFPYVVCAAAMANGDLFRRCHQHYKLSWTSRINIFFVDERQVSAKLNLEFNFISKSKWQKVPNLKRADYILTRWLVRCSVPTVLRHVLWSPEPPDCNGSPFQFNNSYNKEVPQAW